jgi:hypothetical protein
LKLNTHFYGLKQAGYNWFAKLSNGLQDCGYVQSNIYPYVFYGQKSIILIYVDDCIIVADTINALINSLHEGDKDFLLQDDGAIDKYLRVEISQLNSLSFELTQPFLIERISKFLGLKMAGPMRN